MLRTVALQAGAVVAAALIAWLVGGGKAGWSALFGGASYTVPNALFALRIVMSVNKPGGTTPATFFLGEFFKIGSTVGLLVLIVWAWRDVVWLALLAGLLVALKSYVLAFLIRK
jgi:ATP synthase protein I